MSSPSNNFRLYNKSRFTDSGRRTSISEYEPKQTFKLAAIRSIAKGVKYNDLSLITGTTTNKLRVENADSQNIEYLASHDNLTSIRKRYDEVKRERTARQNQTQRLKEELQKAKGLQSQYLQKKSNAQNMHQKLQQQLQSKKLHFQETHMDMKCRQHIIHRIKEDKVVFDHRTYVLQKQLNSIKKQLDILKRQQNEAGQSSDRARKVYQKLLHQIQAQQIQRQEHLNNLKESIRKKDDLNKSTAARQSEILQIAERAMQDKDHNQKNWRNLLRVNQFISIMLRDKMERQMSKFYVVETAYKNIKIATGVSDTQTLVNKFLNKQSEYGQLLNKIAQSQKKIQLLKNQNDQSLKQNKQLQQQQALFQIGKRNSVQLEKQYKLLQVIQSKSGKHHLHMEKFTAWISRQLKKLQKLNPENNKTNLINSNNLQQLIDYYCQLIKNNLQFIKKSEQVQLSTTDNTDINTSDLGKKQIDKIQRINFKKVRKNEQQVLEDEEEEKLPTGYDQQQFILSNRMDLLKQNDKFMKQLKKRTQIIMKNKIDNQSPPKKKESQKNIAKISDDQIQ